MTNGLSDAPPPGSIGARLLAILHDRGWSLSRLARESERIGQPVSLSQLSMLARGVIESPRTVTIERICATLGIPERMLTREADTVTDPSRASYESTTTVEIVQILKGGTMVLTGETVGIETSLAVGRRPLCVQIDGGGMAPHCMIGDRVVFDPNEAPAHGAAVVLLVGAATTVAWCVRSAGGTLYQQADGTWIRPEDALCLGVVLEIKRRPPVYQPR